MAADEARLRDDLCRWGRSLFERGLTPGASGNLSARLDDGYLVTPTNACLGFLDPARLSKLDPDGQLISGDPPTKEVPLHKAMYDARPGAGGVVHLHSSWATALSCLKDLDPENALPPITPYVVMRVGRVPVVPYMRPGSPAMRDPVLALARDHAAILLANHGPVVAAPTFEAAVFAAEEVEEAAKLFFITRGLAINALSADQIAELEASFRLR
jgi:ribulose-5-phosphate 4-epimerase/fuculose-1-phosphate aldolase